MEELLIKLMENAYSGAGMVGAYGLLASTISKEDEMEVFSVSCLEIREGIEFSVRRFVKARNKEEAINDLNRIGETCGVSVTGCLSLKDLEELEEITRKSASIFVRGSDKSNLLNERKKWIACYEDGAFGVFSACCEKDVQEVLEEKGWKVSVIINEEFLEEEILEVRAVKERKIEVGENLKKNIDDQQDFENFCKLFKADWASSGILSSILMYSYSEYTHKSEESIKELIAHQAFDSVMVYVQKQAFAAHLPMVAAAVGITATLVTGVVLPCATAYKIISFTAEFSESPKCIKNLYENVDLMPLPFGEFKLSVPPDINKDHKSREDAYLDLVEKTKNLPVYARSRIYELKVSQIEFLINSFKKEEEKFNPPTKYDKRKIAEELFKRNEIKEMVKYGMLSSIIGATIQVCAESKEGYAIGIDSVKAIGAKLVKVTLNGTELVVKSEKAIPKIPNINGLTKKIDDIAGHKKTTIDNSDINKVIRSSTNVGL